MRDSPSVEQPRDQQREAGDMHPQLRSAVEFPHPEQQQGERDLFHKIGLHPHLAQHFFVAAVAELDVLLHALAYHQSGQHDEQKAMKPRIQRRYRDENGHYILPKM